MRTEGELMTLKPFKTHVGLTINPPHKDGDDFVTTLEGDRIKEIERGSLAKATVTFRETVKHYEERKKAEA
jgi:hypothetical protein